MSNNITTVSENTFDSSGGTNDVLNNQIIERNNTFSSMKIITDVEPTSPLVPEIGALAIDAGTLKFWNGSTWITVGEITPQTPFVYNFEKVTNILNIGTTFTSIVSLTATIPAATYQFGFSMSYVFPNATNSVQFRFSLDGGTNWFTFTVEAKDTTDNLPFVYLFPIDYAGGTPTVVLEARKEGGTQSFNVLFADIWLQQLTPTTP